MDVTVQIVLGATRRPTDVTAISLGTASAALLLTSSIASFALSTLVGLGPRLGALIDDVNAVSSAVGDGETKPEGHHDNRDDPEEVESEPNQAKEQGDGQHRRHHGVRALLLAK
jgi:hypothetical protein